MEGGEVGDREWGLSGVGVLGMDLDGVRCCCWGARVGVVNLLREGYLGFGCLIVCTEAFPICV